MISKKGKFFKIKNDDIYDANESKLGYINEKTEIKNDNFIKILPSNQYLEIETNKNKSARIDLNKLCNQSNKTRFEIDFLNLEKDENIINCFRFDKFLN